MGERARCGRSAPPLKTSISRRCCAKRWGAWPTSTPLEAPLAFSFVKHAFAGQSGMKESGNATAPAANSAQLLSHPLDGVDASKQQLLALLRPCRQSVLQIPDQLSRNEIVVHQKHARNKHVPRIKRSNHWMARGFRRRSGTRNNNSRGHGQNGAPAA